MPRAKTKTGGNVGSKAKQKKSAKGSAANARKAYGKIKTAKKAPRGSVSKRGRKIQ